MNTLVPIDQANVPSLMRQRMAAGRAASSNFSEGIRDAFPLLSIKGKVFRARISGQETPFIDPNTRQPIAYLDVVMVNASRTLAKTYYVRGFAEGDMNPPDCWSLDSVRPDPSVANKVSLTCGNCPMNAFGSRITESGKPAKACQDARRVAIMMPHQLGDPNPMVLMMRVPQSSLKNLKAYAQMLERHGFEPAGCVTRLAFDYQEAFPKLLFNFVSPLSDAQYQRVVEMSDGDLVTSMLAAPDFENAPSSAPHQDTGGQHTGIGGLAPQTAPVLDSQPVQVGPVLQPMQAPVQAPVQTVPPGLVEMPDGRMFNPATQQFEQKPEPQKPDLRVVQSNLIELPDGRMFDPATKQYVERPQPAVQMAELDPTTLTLPDGKFFNTVSRQFVTGPEKGAKAVVHEQPVVRERKRRTKAEMEAARQAEAAAAAGQAQVAPGITQPQQPEPQPTQPEPQPPQQPQPHQPEPTTPPAANPNGDASHGVRPIISAASLPLQEILQKLVPTT